MEVIRKAAEAGDPFARNELPIAYDYGNLGIGRDFEKASDHLTYCTAWVTEAELVL
jgi:TPR repeat protein